MDAGIFGNFPRCQWQIKNKSQVPLHVLTKALRVDLKVPTWITRNSHSIPTFVEKAGNGHDVMETLTAVDQ